jgi:hypothetical protein
MQGHYWSKTSMPVSAQRRLEPLRWRQTQPQRMNANSPSEHHAVTLVDIIDFKWLMVGDGHHVHVERLQKDAGYAARCLAAAGASPNEAVRAAAVRLGRLLGHAPAQPLTEPSIARNSVLSTFP